MKLTIQASEKFDRKEKIVYPKITVEYEADDMSIEECIENLVVPAMIGFGYSDEQVRERLNVE